MIAAGIMNLSYIIYVLYFLLELPDEFVYYTVLALFFISLPFVLRQFKYIKENNLDKDTAKKHYVLIIQYFAVVLAFGFISYVLVNYI